MTENLGRCGDERDQVMKLSAEFLDAQVVNVKEIVGLSLFGKTGSGKREFGGKDDGTAQGSALDSQDITLDMVIVRKRRSGRRHLES